MKKVLIGLGIAVVVVVVAALAIPGNCSGLGVQGTAAFRHPRRDRPQGADRRRFSFSLLPTVQFTAGKVSLANAPGAKTPNMVTLDKLNVKVALLPLLHGAVEVDSFVLKSR